MINHVSIRPTNVILQISLSIVLWCVLVSGSGGDDSFIFWYEEPEAPFDIEYPIMSEQLSKIQLNHVKRLAISSPSSKTKDFARIVTFDTAGLIMSEELVFRKKNVVKEIRERTQWFYNEQNKLVARKYEGNLKTIDSFFYNADGRLVGFVSRDLQRQTVFEITLKQITESETILQVDKSLITYYLNKENQLIKRQLAYRTDSLSVDTLSNSVIVKRWWFKWGRGSYIMGKESINESNVRETVTTYCFEKHNLTKNIGAKKSTTYYGDDGRLIFLITGFEGSICHYSYNEFGLMKMESSHEDDRLLNWLYAYEFW
ncbi:MAG: hypothetical protein H6607_07390 [Flavobacteriales bacterium]|nr:hypothetical protein [Flavobacteriales bacterium]